PAERASRSGNPSHGSRLRSESILRLGPVADHCFDVFFSPVSPDAQSNALACRCCADQVNQLILASNGGPVQVRHDIVCSKSSFGCRRIWVDHLDLIAGGPVKSEPENISRVERLRDMHTQITARYSPFLQERTRYALHDIDW